MPTLLAGQLLHAAGLTVLLGAVVVAWRALGSPHPCWFWCAVAVPVLHQVFVWLAWRSQLRTRLVERTIGFGGYLAVFAVLFTGRFVTLLGLSWVDRGALGWPPAAHLAAALALAVPGLYAMYGVHRYFGFERAAGADHFDPRFRDLPLVNRGIFRVTSNGMYAFAFLLLWAIALVCNSSSGLLVAAFSHAYVWVHYFGTERPDMRFLYGPRRA